MAFLKNTETVLPITEKQILESAIPFETQILNGKQFYIQTDPEFCAQFWVYFWALKAKENYFFDKVWTNGNVNMSMPVKIDLNNMWVYIQPELSGPTFKKIMFVNVSMWLLVFLWVIFVIGYLAYHWQQTTKSDEMTILNGDVPSIDKLNMQMINENEWNV